MRYANPNARSNSNRRGGNSSSLANPRSSFNDSFDTGRSRNSSNSSALTALLPRGNKHGNSGSVSAFAASLMDFERGRPKRTAAVSAAAATAKMLELERCSDRALERSDSDNHGNRRDGRQGGLERMSGSVDDDDEGGDSGAGGFKKRVRGDWRQQAAERIAASAAADAEFSVGIGGGDEGGMDRSEDERGGQDDGEEGEEGGREDEGEEEEVDNDEEEEAEGAVADDMGRGEATPSKQATKQSAQVFSPSRKRIKVNSDEEEEEEEEEEEVDNDEEEEAEDNAQDDQNDTAMHEDSDNDGDHASNASNEGADDVDDNDANMTGGGSSDATNTPVAMALAACQTALGILSVESISAPFMHPVDLVAFPDYLDFVSTPMSFDTVIDSHHLLCPPCMFESHYSSCCRKHEQIIDPYIAYARGALCIAVR